MFMPKTAISQNDTAVFTLWYNNPRETIPTPCRQCIVMENGKQSICGRCIDVEGLCEQCGYFFAAEYVLVFKGNVRVIAEMLSTYLKYI